MTRAAPTTNPMSTRVAVLGGGVGGLSAAQELAERGFEVVVYEHRPDFGGKARSIPVPNSATPGRSPLPGEHGSNAAKAQLWAFQEPEFFKPMREYDLLRFKLGLPHGDGV